MPAAEHVGAGAGGRLLCTLFWYIVLVLWWTATQPGVTWG